MIPIGDGDPREYGGTLPDGRSWVHPPYGPTRISNCPSPPYPLNYIEWHWPKCYRYKVAHPKRFKPGFNRYPGVIIGAQVCIGRYAYCIKWGWARVKRSHNV